MTLAFNDRYVLYSPVVLTTNFNVDFPIFDNDDLEVKVDGIVTTAYTMTASYVDGQSTDAVVILDTGANGVDVEITGAREPRQENTYPTKGKNLAKNLLRDIDSTTAVQQEQLLKINEALADASAAATSAAAALVSENAAAASEAAAAASEAAAIAAENSLLEWKGAWVTSTTYAPSDIVIVQGTSYVCLVGHVSGTFATDLANVNWEIFAEADFNANLSLPVLTAGSANAYTLTLTETVPAYFVGLAFRARFHVANTGTTTINIDGLGVIPLRKRDNTDSLIEVVTNDLGIYETHEFVIQAGFIAEMVSLPLRELTDQIGLVPIVKRTASASASLDFTEFDTTLYDHYIFEVANLVPATDGQALFFLTSSDGGATYDTGASDYSHAVTDVTHEITEVETHVGDDANTGIVVADQVNNDANYGVSFTLKVMGPHLAKYTGVHWQGVSFNPGTTGIGQTMVGGAWRLSAADVDAGQFKFASGNIASGEVTMYGVRAL